jgi:hypothetical protein
VNAYTLSVIHTATQVSDQDSVTDQPVITPQADSYVTKPSTAGFYLGNLTTHISNITLSWQGPAVPAGDHYMVIRTDHPTPPASPVSVTIQVNPTDVLKTRKTFSWSDISIGPADTFTYQIGIADSSNNLISGGDLVTFNTVPIQTYFARPTQKATAFQAQKARMTASSASAPASGETVSWNWDRLSIWKTAVTFKLFRTDDPFNVPGTGGSYMPNSNFNRFKSGVVGQAPEDTAHGQTVATITNYSVPESSGQNYADTTYYYTVAAYINGIAFAQTTVLVPQVYMLLGNGDTNGLVKQEFYDNKTNGFQVHTYVFGGPGNQDAQLTEATADMWSAPATIQHLVAGISFGGGEATGLTYKVSVDALALIDPVAPYENYYTLPAGCNAFNTANLDQHPKPVPTGNANSDPYSTFVPNSTAYHDWYAPYATEYNAYKALTPTVDDGYATGFINARNDTVHNDISPTGTVHTAQVLDPTIGGNIATWIGNREIDTKWIIST